jgi:hypothetical protein
MGDVAQAERRNARGREWEAPARGPSRRPRGATQEGASTGRCTARGSEHRRREHRRRKQRGVRVGG